MQNVFLICPSLDQIDLVVCHMWEIVGRRFVNALSFSFPQMNQHRNGTEQ